MDKIQTALTKMFLSSDAGVVADACAIQCLKLIATERTETAATDGIVLLYNPKFVETLTVEQAIGLLVHELCHVRFEHNARFADWGDMADHESANRAMDMEINPLVRTAGYRLPPGGVWPDDIGQPDGLSWEEYYTAMNQQQPEQQDEAGDGNSDGNSDGESDGNSDGNSATKQPEQQPADETGDDAAGQQDGQPEADAEKPEPSSQQGHDAQQGGQQQPQTGQQQVAAGAHATGSLTQEFAPELLEEGTPEELAERVADAIEDATATNTKVEKPEHVKQHVAGTGTSDQQMSANELLIASDCRWQDVVIDLLASKAAGDTVADWSKPNRRSINSATYRPSRRKVCGYKLALVVDVSGSCVQFFDAWQSLAREMVDAIPQLTELEIVYHDTRVKGFTTWRRREGMEVEIASRGGGGTCHREALAIVEQLDVDGAVLFTDSESSWPRECSVDCVTVQPPGSYEVTPFGKTIRITNW